MRYIINQKMLCLGDDFSIQDDQGQDLYYVDGRALALGDKLAFNDLGGNELAFISQKLLSFRPTYEIYRGDELFARVTKDFTLFKDRFTVDVPGPNDYAVQGDFMDWEYEITRGSRVVATISKQWGFADTYGVNVVDGEDDITLLATAIVIDLVCHDGKD